MRIGTLPKPQTPPANARVADAEEIVPSRSEKVSHFAGLSMQSLAGVPRLLDTHGWVTEALSLRESLPWINKAAASAGILGTVGLVGAGALQVADGFKRHNHAEQLSGAAEITRGLYVGAWTACWESGPLTTQGNDFHRLGNALSLVSGGLLMAGGLARMTHKKPAGTDVSPRVVGMLEAGMGATWMAAFMGVHPVICIAARCGLGIAKAGYIHKDQLGVWKDRVERTIQD